MPGDRIRRDPEPVRPPPRRSPASVGSEATLPECRPTRSTRPPARAGNSRCRASAARQAPSAWCSIATGTPNRAMMPSPSVRSTVPPCPSTTATMRSMAGCRRCMACSGSSAAICSVEPATSANRMVAGLTSPHEGWRGGSDGAWASGAAATGLPQAEQKRAPGSQVAPQWAQAVLRAVPQAAQKRAPCGLANRHLGHSMRRMLRG